MTVKKDIRCMRCNADASEIIEFYEDADWDIINVVELKEKARLFDELIALATEADSTNALYDWLAENVITRLS